MTKVEILHRSLFTSYIPKVGEFFNSSIYSLLVNWGPQCKTPSSPPVTMPLVKWKIIKFIIVNKSPNFYSVN